ncbi:hypothetical protein TREES_T100009762 [Tupaia chinensis]|uniref:Uncharacterized protein n=1 Tax=Tupaia chinensis TaxID=246437 RepID=L9KVL2_TUPCH|nr:hypothetical protein TREES_T100009762 [Tupaia chinensis]
MDRDLEGWKLLHNRWGPGRTGRMGRRGVCVGSLHASERPNWKQLSAEEEGTEGPVVTGHNQCGKCFLPPNGLGGGSRADETFLKN